MTPLRKGARFTCANGSTRVSTYAGIEIEDAFVDLDRGPQIVTIYAGTLDDPLRFRPELGHLMSERHQLFGSRLAFGSGPSRASTPYLKLGRVEAVPSAICSPETGR